MNISGSEDEGDSTLKINKGFAAYYDKARRSEELMKLKARYGDVNIGAGADDTDSESEDEDAEELTPTVEKNWLKTLAALKSNDPRLYDQTTKFFDSEDEGEPKPKNIKKKKKKKEERITLKDMDRKVITERDGQYSESSTDGEEDDDLPKDKSYFEEQDEIRQSIKKAQNSSDNDDEDGADLLKVKIKTTAEKEAEEEEYRKFIKGQTANIDKKDLEELAGLRQFWNRDDLSEADKFLKDYILEKKYLSDMPDLENISESESETEQQQFHFQDFSDAEEEKAEKFELKYNFRFEEPDPEFIKSYPRTIESSMRSEKNKRKEKRAKNKERKQKEKNKRQEELNRLKNLKRQEIEEKLKAIMEKSGAARMPFTSEDMDDDFDPDEHDKKMQEMFPDENVDEELEEKPKFDYDPDIDDADDWDHFKVGPETEENTDNADDETHYVDLEDPSFNMDADYDPNSASLEDRNFGLDGRSKRNKRKQNRLKKALLKKKPLFDPSDKTFEEYLDEYYGLECEDIIGDMKCRFPYRQVPANDFGLTVGEILAARDKELNAWSSLKKAVQYRTDEEEHRDIAKFRRKGKDVTKKMHMLPSVYKPKETVQSDAAEPDGSDPAQVAESTMPDTTETEVVKETIRSTEKSVKNSDTSNINPKKRKAKWKGKKNVDKASQHSSKGMAFSRMEAYGMHKEVKRVKKLKARDKKFK